MTMSHAAQESPQDDGGPELGMRGYRIVDPERTAERREEILAAAAKVFAEQGYDRATIADIAQAMGVSKGVVYYLFRSKEEVVFAIMVDTHLEAHRRLAEANASSGSHAERFRAALRALASYNLDEATRYRSMALSMSNLSMLSARNRAHVMQLRRDGQRVLTSMVEEGQRAGVFVPGEPHVLAQTAVTAALGVSRWFRPGRSATAGEVADLVSEQLLRSVLASPCAEGTHAHD